MSKLLKFNSFVLVQYSFQTGRLLVIVQSPIATLVGSNEKIKWKNLIELNKSLV